MLKKYNIYSAMLSLLSLVLIMGQLVLGQSALAAPIHYHSSDVIKSGSAFHLGVSGYGKFLLDGPGSFSYDTVAGTVDYTASVVSAAGTSGFDIELHLKAIPTHAPRCYEFDCSGPYYTFGGIDPITDWSFFEVDTEKTNLLSGFGDLSGVLLEILGDKWFQMGDGAGGAKVLPEALQFSGWFGLKDLVKGTVTRGDLNGNLAKVSESALFPLLFLGLMGLTLVSRGRRSFIA